MYKQISIDIADEEFAQVNQAIQQAGFELDEYLNYVLRGIGSSRYLNGDAIERIFHLLPDDLISKMATTKMKRKESKRHSELLEKQEKGKLLPKEQKELHRLAEEYERGTLRKAFAMAEAVRRGLIPPVEICAALKSHSGNKF